MNRSLPPKGAEIVQVKNITTLLYTNESLPADVHDVRQIVLKICNAESLQQIHAVSGSLSGDEARSKFASACKESLRRYGQATEGDPANGTVSWNEA